MKTLGKLDLPPGFELERDPDHILILDEAGEVVLKFTPYASPAVVEYRAWEVYRSKVRPRRSNLDERRGDASH